MTAKKSDQTGSPGTLVVSSRLKTVYWGFTFIGFLTFGATYINQPERAWHAYLVALFFFVSLSLGGLFFVAIQHVTKAGWSVNIRRVCESFTEFLPIGFIASLVLLLGARHLYSWWDAGTVAADALLIHKSSYLNPTFFAIRIVAFFGLWLLFKFLIVGRSLAQDKSGDVSLTHKMVAPSVIFLLVFALSYSLFGVDTLMSLDPHWFSTIFGIYCFAGLFQSTMAVAILTIVYLQSKGLLKGFVNDNHLHDLGKFLFAFTVFWAYIAFSQFMLIWYANLPEETMFFIPRMEGGWVLVSLTLVVGKFILPFLLLLPQWVKRSGPHLAVISVWVLAMQFVDIYWLVYPNLNEHKVVFFIPEILIFLGFAGLFLKAIADFLSRNTVVPYRDPRIDESLDHHVVY